MSRELARALMREHYLSTLTLMNGTVVIKFIRE